MAQLTVWKAIRSNLSWLWGHFFGKSQGNKENLRSAYLFKFWHRRALTGARRNQTSLSRLWKRWVDDFQLRAHVISSHRKWPVWQAQVQQQEKNHRESFLGPRRVRYWKSLIVCAIQQGLSKRIHWRVSPGSLLLVFCFWKSIKLWLRHERAIVRIDEQRQAQLNIEKHRFTESLYSNKPFMEEFQLAQQRVHIELEQFRA